MLLFLIAPQIKEYFTLNAIIYFKYYNYRGYVIISYCSTNQRIFHIECNHLFSNIIIIVGMLLFFISTNQRIFHIECNHLFSNIIIIGGMLLFLIAPQIKEYFTLNAIIYFQIL